MCARYVYGITIAIWFEGPQNAEFENETAPALVEVMTTCVESAYCRYIEKCAN